MPHGLIPPAGRAQATGAAVPARLLSETVAGASADALERAAAGPAEHTLRLTELAPSVCLPALLARWDGEYSLAAAPARGEPGRLRGAPAEALVRFQRAEALAEAYGLTTASVGAEPGRHVVVYKARPRAPPASARRSCLVWTSSCLSCGWRSEHVSPSARLRVIVS